MEGTPDHKSRKHRIEFDDDGPVVGAELIAGLLGLSAHQVPKLLRQQSITTLYEAGAEEHEGGFRLSFFHSNRRAQIEVDSDGRILSRTVIDFGDRPLPASLRGPQQAS